MQTVSFQQSSRASSNPMIFPCHQSESAEQDLDHRDICSAVRAWAAAEGLDWPLYFHTLFIT